MGESKWSLTSPLFRLVIVAELHFGYERQAAVPKNTEVSFPSSYHPDVLQSAPLIVETQ